MGEVHFVTPDGHRISALTKSQIDLRRRRVKELHQQIQTQFEAIHDEIMLLNAQIVSLQLTGTCPPIEETQRRKNGTS